MSFSSGGVSLTVNRIYDGSSPKAQHTKIDEQQQLDMSISNQTPSFHCFYF